ncbi:ComF family protein [Bacteroidota bacterium]
MNKIASLAADFIYLLYPERCITCEDALYNHEKIICTKCLLDIPKFTIEDYTNNEMAKLFWGRAKIENTFALYIFQKEGKFQQLMHELKYRNNKAVGLEFGKILGKKILKTQAFKGVDVIIPVPLHWKKLKKRGYNQSELIAESVSKELGKPLLTNCLYRKIESTTQTKKTRYERWQNVEDIFGIKNMHKIENKHILLIDDIVTTGSTLEACANCLLKAKNSKISIATLAVA